MPRKPLNWETRVSLFRNPLIAKQLLLAIGVPFGLVVAVMVLTAGADRWIYALYGLSLIGALFLLTALLLHFLYGGKYAVGFTTDDKGIRCYTQSREARRGRIVNNLTVVLGLLTGKFSVAGAGMLAQARQEVTLNWRAVQKVSRYPASHTILLRAGYLDTMAVFCTPDNFSAVSDLIREKSGL
jgi:hypothetical protein